MEKTTVRLLIHGRVQGVGYRWWARGEAGRLGVAGWIRNRRDGAVELAASGSPAAIEALIEACWRGPPGAAVASIDQLPAAPEDWSGFEQRPTV